MKAIFWTEKNGATVSFDEEFESNGKALEYCQEWIEIQEEHTPFITGERNVAVKPDAVKSITIKELEKSEE